MKRYAYVLTTAAVLLSFLRPGAAVLGQQRTELPGQRNAAVYYLGTDDQLLIPVNVWGFVSRPGQYYVPNKTDLISLLSYAGGPSEDAKVSDIKIVRTDPKAGRMVIPVNVKKYLNTADERLIPLLKPGDTVIVRGTTFYWIKSTFEFLGRLTVFAQIFYFIAIANEYNRR
ncbi:SLBB domain-containing protein [bacterium]|nr:SLBB domain-containing protein [bacterium]